MHALVGGAMSAVQGGKLLDGFITHGLAAIGGSLAFASPLGTVPGNAGRMLRSAFAGTFGGLGAQLTGGKFANGFLTGAFAHLWNAERGGLAPNTQHEAGVRAAIAEYAKAGYELVAAGPVAVDVPGFPMPRTMISS